jgi:arabinogalactan oligomer/maltooligosaccharide transport system substrate-binding protein
MKKSVYLIVSALFVVLLVACSKPAGTDGGETGDSGKNSQTENVNANETDGEDLALEPEDGAELILWGTADAEAEWAEYMMEKFTEEYGIPISYEEVSHTDAPGKLQTDGPAGLGGDVFMAPHDHVGNMNTAGLIYENYYADEYQERFMEGAFQGVSAVSDGELVTYGYPLAIETVALYYNKDLLDEMGFEPAETMEELIAQSKEFMEKHPGSYGFMLEPGNFYYTHAFLGGYGGYIFGDDNTNPDDLGLNSEEAVKSGELLLRIRDEILPLKQEDITGDIIGSYFDEGKLLYNMTGPWSLGGHLEAGVNVGITTMPKLENGEIPTTFSGVKAFFVNSYSDYPKAATLLAKFATSDEMLLKRYEMTNELPPSNALLESTEIKENEYNIAFLEQAQYSISMPNIPEMESVWGGMEVAYTAIWNGAEKPKDALDKGTQQIKDAFESRTQ